MSDFNPGDHMWTYSSSPRSAVSVAGIQKWGPELVRLLAHRPLKANLREKLLNFEAKVDTEPKLGDRYQSSSFVASSLAVYAPQRRFSQAHSSTDRSRHNDSGIDGE